MGFEVKAEVLSILRAAMALREAPIVDAAAQTGMGSPGILGKPKVPSGRFIICLYIIIHVLDGCMNIFSIVGHFVLICFD